MIARHHDEVLLVKEMDVLDLTSVVMSFAVVAAPPRVPAVEVEDDGQVELPCLQSCQAFVRPPGFEVNIDV